MKTAVSINVARVQHQLNAFSLKFSSTNPDQATNPSRHSLDFQNLTGRQRIEITNQNMKAFLVTFDSFEE
jgi:hypothetical protein